MPAPNIPDFRLIKPIGEGGVGEIWMGLDLLENYRAIKIIRQNQFKRLKDYQAEFHGIRKYAPLSQNHPGLIEIHHAGIRNEEGFYYYIMSLADDLEHGTNINPEKYQPKTLRTYLDFCDGRIPLEEAKQIAVEITAALDELHSEGLVHRDIKPDNILCVEGRWELADIGFVSDAGSRSQVGTIGYMAPEGPGKPMADILSLGKVLYEISSGNDVSDFPDYPSWVFDSPDDRKNFQEVNDIVLKATDPIADNRFENAAELLKSLLKITHQQTDTPKEPKLESRSPFTYSAVLVLIVGFVWYFVSSINQTIENNETDPGSDTLPTTAPQSPDTVDKPSKTVFPPANLPSNLRQGLVAYYPFNGNAKDESGNGYHAKIYEKVSLGQDRHSKAESAYYFDGQLGYMKLPIKAMEDTGDACTVSLWVNPLDRSPNSIGTIFNAMSGGPSNRRYIDFQRGGQIQGRLGNPSLVIAKAPIEPNRWHHVILLWRNNSSDAEMFLDGKSIGKNPKQYWLKPSLKPGDIWVGGWTKRSKSAIDDIRIYNRALSYEEVESLHKAEKP